MRTKFGIYYPRNFANEYVLYRITTLEGLQEFEDLIYSGDVNSEAHTINSKVFRHMKSPSTWEGEYVSFSVVSDDPKDAEYGYYGSEEDTVFRYAII